MHQNGAILRNYSDWRLLFLGGKLVLREGGDSNSSNTRDKGEQWLAFALERGGVDRLHAEDQLWAGIRNNLELLLLAHMPVHNLHYLLWQRSLTS